MVRAMRFQQFSLLIVLLVPILLQGQQAANPRSNSQGAGSSAETFTVALVVFIPSDNVIGPPQYKCGIRYRQCYFVGDNRTYDPVSASAIDCDKRPGCRVKHLIKVLLTDGHLRSTSNVFVGETKSYAPDALLCPTVDARGEAAVLLDCHVLHERDRANSHDVHSDTQLTNTGTVKVHSWGGVANPLVRYAPAFDWDLTLELYINASSGTLGWKLTGAHDGWPAVEMYVNGTLIYKHYPGDPPYTLSDVAKLFPPMDKQVSIAGYLP